MIVKLLDYEGKEVNVDVGDIETIAKMSIKVMTGDEILTVVYKDYTVKEFDSSDCRFSDYFDDLYPVYDAFTGLNRFNDETFINRTKSYWRYDDKSEL